MAAGNWIMYDSCKKYLVDGTIDFDTATIKMALLSSSYTPALTHVLYTDLTNELSTANGYTSGGASVTGVVTQSTSTTKLTASADTTWTASGGSIVARYAVLYVAATVNSIVKPLIGYVLLDTAPADVTTTTGNTLTITRPTNGFFTLTGATS